MNVLERDFFTDPEILRDPLPYYRALHERGPVIREPHKGVFMLSRMDEITEVYTDHERFSAIVGPLGPLVDVPVSDVETALLRQGSIAHVVLEGERQARAGTVILTRGSAGTLGSHDLAALAKGRRAGIGQALVELTPSPADIKACSIGRAAFVDFPEVGVIDLVRARLRW